MKKLASLLAAALLCCLASSPLKAEEGEVFGGWEFLELSHSFSGTGLSATAYAEFDNVPFNSFDCWYMRLSLGYKLLPWLKVGVNYVPVRNPGYWQNYAEVDLVGSLKSGVLGVSLRERYRHGWDPEGGAGSHELRSRLKVDFRIPDSAFTPYAAAEVFTWGTTWKKTRHYLGCTYDFSSSVQMEAYYLYYVFKNSPAQHILGLGLNFSF